jgi:CubicO group peptidase (beta-lactamase class C family)
LGYTLCKIENRTYNDLLQEKIFSKYGMTNSSAVRSELEDDLVSGLNKNGFKTPNWDFAALESAGAILSTAEDLSKFAVAQFDESDEDLELTRQQTFTINDNEGMGLGWFISKTSTGGILYRHKGVTGGYTSAMAIDTENETGIIILSNVSGFSRKMGNIDALCFELLAALSNDKQ